MVYMNRFDIRNIQGLSFSAEPDHKYYSTMQNKTGNVQSPPKGARVSVYSFAPEKIVCILMWAQMCTKILVLSYTRGRGTAKEQQKCKGEPSEWKQVNTTGQAASPPALSGCQQQHEGWWHEGPGMTQGSAWDTNLSKLCRWDCSISALSLEQ